jgi:hypothetical protein
MLNVVLGEDVVTTYPNRSSRKLVSNVLPVSEADAL